MHTALADRPVYAAHPPMAPRDVLILLAGLIAFAFAHFVFSHNSGFGYDAYEYLVIGRSLNRGFAFYDLVPSKSWAMYGFTSTLMALGVPLQHKSVAALVAVLATLVVACVYMVTRRIAGPKAATIGAVLAALCAMFMEMNFYEPQTFVTLGGLGAFAVLADGRRRASALWLVVAGLSLAMGFHFKSVAAFYGVAILMWAAVETLRGGLTPAATAHMLAWVFVGGAAGLAAPAAYFAATGRLHEWWVWSVAFPVFHYPPNTTWLSKLYVKLGWFHALLIAVVGFSLTANFRRPVWNDARLTLAFLMGACSYLALFKTQSSQYCYPGAIFFVIFIAGAVGRVLPGVSARAILGGLAGAAALLVIALLGTYLYRPSAIARFSTLKPFPSDDVRSSYIRAKLRPGDRGVFVTASTMTYYQSGINPGWVVPNTDVQTTYLYKTDAARLFAGLSDPRTKLIEFNPAKPEFEDNDLRGTPLGARFTADLLAAMAAAGFFPATDAPAGERFWVRASS